MRNKIKKLTERDFVISRCELEELLQKSSEKGAKMALSELGLNDRNAANDIKDLRELLKAFRMAKKDAFRVSVKWIAVGIITLITAGLISLFGDHINLK
jgi:glutamate synthase domain-containing protein 2